LAAGLVALAAMPAAAQSVRVGGTGFVIATMRALGEQLAQARPDIHTIVLPSLGTTGGLAALGEGAIELAVAARPLRDDERAKGLREAACATTALLFATSRPQGSDVALRDVPNLFAARSPTWPDGEPLKVILRARDGSENPYLAARVPGMADALAAAFKRPGIAVGGSDQENAELAQRAPGSFAIITLLQILTERLSLQPLSLDGIAPSAETIAAGTWPLPLRFCLVVPSTPSAGARQLVAHFGSPDGRALLGRAGAVPVE
jgi:phosphate transport system substrate-binding protein